MITVRLTTLCGCRRTWQQPNIPHRFIFVPLLADAPIIDVDPGVTVEVQAPCRIREFELVDHGHDIYDFEEVR